MAIPIMSLVNRLRSKVDAVQQGKDILVQDGTSYTVPLSFKPIVSGTDVVYISHATYTTGYNQFVPRNHTQSLGYSSGTNLAYEIDYNRGELYFYRGSGYNYASNELNPFAPWSTSTITAYYDYSKYNDNVLAEYVSYAVAGVEASLHIGMIVSGCSPTNLTVSGCNNELLSSDAPPYVRRTTDKIQYKTESPYDYKFVITEDVEIIQELIAMKAAFDLITRERRVGAGDAIKIVDGDTQIDTSVNQRYLADFVKDMKADYTDMVKWVMYNMAEGYNIRQIDEMPYSQFSPGTPYIEY